MKEKSRKQLLGISLYGLLILIAGYAIKIVLPEWIYTHFLWLVIFFLVINLASLLVVNSAIESDQENISRNFFGAMIVRLFLSVTVALVIIYFDREGSSVFAVNFIILYLMFLGFEIYTLMANLQAHSGDHKYPHDNEEKN